ncbi:hypothetical protein HYW21_05840 [Candidatus Woesearchaeota archaeon]|nr:hypothetical protein [Candidatus Woesearchaeota archaeon]
MKPTLFNELMINIAKRIALFFILMFLIGTLPLSSALIDVTVNLTYDRNGNLMQDANYHYQYNSEHQLSKVRDKNATGRILAAYWYDGNGQRLKKVVFHEDGSNTTTYYIHDDFVREIGPDGIARDTVYYRDLDGTLLARKDPDGKKYFYHPDALGSTALVTDEAGNVVEEVEYLPFGEVIEGGNDRYLFTGKEKDRETGLQYYNARYYAPDQARFIQPDSVQPNVYDPQQLNKYSYARNNPVKYTDPSGNVPIDTLGDIGFMIWDVYVIATKGSGKGGENWKTLGMDTVGLFVPYTTGLGKAYKAGKAAKIVDKGVDLNKAAKIGTATDKVIDAKRQEQLLLEFQKNSDFLKKSKNLKETGEATAGSFREANALRMQTFPEAKKFPGAGPKSTPESLKAFKAYDGTAYHTDYLVDQSTGKMYGHPPDSIHANSPHINIKDNKNKYTITIDDTKR